ncbi:MAG: hypothetical protein ACHREM_24390 [Polyangiales bacterium]
MKSLPLLASIALVSLAAACGAAPPIGSVGADPRALARLEGEHIWRSKCGACHAPVDPGSHARDELVHALSRHRKRIRLDSTQWQAVTEFLATDR